MTILLTTDFSPNAHWADNYALQLAMHTRARLVILHVYDALPGGVTDGDWLATSARSQGNQAMQKLSSLRSQMQQTSKGAVTIAIVARPGSPANGIEREVAEQKPDLLVMNIVGDEPRKARQQGSLATDLIPRMPVPMLLVPPGSTYQMPRTLVLALDLSQPINAIALGGVRRFARLFGATVDIICVEDEPEPPLKLAARHIRTLLADTPHTFSFLPGYDLTLTLDAYLAEHRADLIMLLPKPHSLFQLLLQESVTQLVARTTSIPILATFSRDAETTRPMKKILLLTDFSEASHNALRYVRSFLSDTIADIHLLCAYPVESNDDDEKYVAETAKHAFRDDLNEMLDDLRRDADNDWHTFRATARVGALLDVVRDVLRTTSYDYVVVGAKKDGTNELFGNGATSLVRHLRANVMVVPVDTRFNGVVHVVLATNFANLKNCKLLWPVKELAALKGAQVTLLTIDVPSKDVVHVDQELRIRRFFRPIDPSVAHARAASAKEGITRYVSTHPTDLLVMIPRHRNWTDAGAATSVSRSLTFRPTVPTLTLYDDGSTDRPQLIEDLAHIDSAV